MSAPEVQRARRLAALLSLRTISGKLIIGLVVLFGLASVIVSLITASSLNNSLMSSLDQQLVAATRTWYTCVQQSTGPSQHDMPTTTTPSRLIPTTTLRAARWDRPPARSKQ